MKRMGFRIVILNVRRVIIYKNCNNDSMKMPEMNLRKFENNNGFIPGIVLKQGSDSFNNFLTISPNPYIFLYTICSCNLERMME